MFCSPFCLMELRLVIGLTASTCLTREAIITQPVSSSFTLVLHSCRDAHLSTRMTKNRYWECLTRSVMGSILVWFVYSVFVWGCVCGISSMCESQRFVFVWSKYTNRPWERSSLLYFLYSRPPVFWQLGCAFQSWYYAIFTGGEMN